MKTVFACVLMLLPVVFGCGESATTEVPVAESDSENATLGTPADAADSAMAAAANETEVTLSPENTTIQFVGLHADPEKPDPRTGRFAEFTGTAHYDSTTLKAIQVEIDTRSLETEIEKLTNHLKSADFFNVNEHPQATFVTKEIIEADGGQVQITGDFTLLGTTKSISFLATVTTDNGLTLDAEFPIDRTEFGMDYGTDNVKKNVAMTIKVDAT